MRLFSNFGQSPQRWEGDSPKDEEPGWFKTLQH
jgi:hypothetical protein